MGAFEGYNGTENSRHVRVMVGIHTSRTKTKNLKTLIGTRCYSSGTQRKPVSPPRFPTLSETRLNCVSRVHPKIFGAYEERRFEEAECSGV